jgi:putative SOS response-associated peptidase YedK
MCGRYALAANDREILNQFGINKADETCSLPRYNIAPSQKVPVIYICNGTKVLATFNWGLIPSWVKDLSKMRPMINARSESLTKKPSFKNSLVSRRCIIPTTGFYEWNKNSKTPMYIHLKNRKVFGMAGLWDIWTNSDGEVIHTCTIITVPANNKLSAIHDRMPAILEPDMESMWLDHNIADTNKLLELLQTYKESEMEFYPVSRRVNSPSLDSQECIIQEAGQLSLFK